MLKRQEGNQTSLKIVWLVSFNLWLNLQCPAVIFQVPRTASGQE